MLCANVIRAMSIIAIDFVVGAITLVHLADCGYMEAKSYVSRVSCNICDLISAALVFFEISNN